ncbi:PREDICTED: small integral membrane protein 14 [Ceratosolen solmsi marchali]|uniref:Small integral membrane protein 14 n=1 Tax=Ceratosolen solmsi marchali TaxID=326594 RepID=A0AAJ6YPY8_9HYME|nr:PREDICTED: small integral membrane protein 14 [Ceratosolen solmsi marchali]XP_011502045.1 PREDICTED: small integral membrane protein 14 [Ceratosolen solmsi marchali]
MSDEDEGFDLCACMWNHDLAMQRLLSILRQSQAYCTDNECLTMSRLPDPANISNDSRFMMVCLFAIFGMLLYALRPNSLRQLDSTKARDSDPDSDGEPPMPPPTIN